MLVGPYLSHPLTRNMKNAHGYTRQGRRSAAATAEKTHFSAADKLTKTPLSEKTF